MEEATIETINAKPEFDLMYYLGVCGTNRIEHELLERIEAAWKDWKDRLHVYKIKPSHAKKDEGFVLIFLNKSVEEAVEDAWEKSPSEGMSFHNLGITMVMSAAQSLVPEVMEKGCAPLPRPGSEVLAAFEKLGLEWNKETKSANRQYAVFTHMPHAGGCEICSLSDTCPNSTLRPMQ